MPPLRPLAWLCLLASLTLTGCLPAPAAGGPATPTPLSTIALPTSPAKPLPEVAFSDLVIRPGERQGEWVVLGMARNKSSEALTAVAVRVALFDAAGETTSETTTLLPLSILLPGVSSPFAARFERAGVVDGARASLDSFRVTSETAPTLSSGAIYATPAPDGVFVHGSVNNDGPAGARAGSVVVAWRDASRSLIGVALASLPGATMAPGESLPWMAHARGATARSHFEVYIAGSVVAGAAGPSLVIADGPDLRETSQGKAFVTGTIRNSGDQPILPEVALALSTSSRPVSLQILRTDIPLQPGEVLAFTVDQFPGLVAALESAGGAVSDLTLDAYLEALPVPPETGAPVQLPVMIVQSEAIGSSLFLQGSVSNSGPAPLKSATVFLSLRSTTGEPLAARWFELETLPDERGVGFSVDLPLAVGVDPAMCEYDVRAFGLLLPESSW